MIVEIATIVVKPGTEAAFLDGVRAALPLFQRAKGFHKVELHRTIEEPATFRLFIHWATLENHMKDFRESSDFLEWRKLVGPYFVQPPQVVHTESVIAG